MRAILFFILLMVVYQAVKVVFRSAMSVYHGGEPRTPRIPGEEMVQDPQCQAHRGQDHLLLQRGLRRRLRTGPPVIVGQMLCCRSGLP
jgi:hypothetical protein